jgi:hypothetical protein
LDDAIVGKNGLMNYNEDNHRIAYLKDYDRIEIVPVLHRNVISFFGMKPRKEYITYRQINDKLIALGRDNTLTTWSAVTGKLLR